MLQRTAYLLLFLMILVCFSQDMNKQEIVYSINIQQIPAKYSEIVGKYANVLTAQQFANKLQQNPQFFKGHKNIYIYKQQLYKSLNLSTNSTRQASPAQNKTQQKIPSSPNQTQPRILNQIPSSGTITKYNQNIKINQNNNNNKLTSSYNSISAKQRQKVGQDSGSTIAQLSRLNNEPPITAPIDELRDYVILLTNNLRAQYKAGKVTVNSFLNKVAQQHSDDMVRRNFFAHKNPDGENIGERARKNGYTGSIGENLAQCLSINQAQQAFIKSQSHFKNAINPQWQQIGVGITRQGNVLFITVLFTPRNIQANKLSSTELQTYKNNLGEAIKTQCPNLKSVDPTLSQIIIDWQNSDRSVPILSYVVRQGRYRKAMTASYYLMDYTKDWVGRAIQKEYFKMDNPIFSRFGLGLKQIDGAVEVYVVYM